MMAKKNYKKARPARGQTKYGKPFAKKSSSGKFKKGTLVRYKYVNGRRVATEKAPRRSR